MVRPITVWHGTDEAIKRLAESVQHNCECDVEHVCGAHKMLTDQYVLDHLAFVQAKMMRYVHAEFDPSSEWW